MVNRFPVYIISKGRFEKTLTATNFENFGIDYLIAVEPQEYENYCKKLGSKRVLKLPFSNLGLGSYPARNFCWEHAKSLGHKYHWLFDDNIIRFQKWIKIFPKDTQTTITNWSQYTIGTESNPRVQIKGCLTWTGDGEFYKFIMNSNEDIKS